MMLAIAAPLAGDTLALASAPVIGFAFGWFLERGGLGSARKLAGQFYLTDLTVFRVMFTAIVTAMLGAFGLAALGLLDLSRVFVPDTFLVAHAVGGIIFGAGFLLAGLCPGTSCVAAASGRIDGFAAAAGMLLGVIAFNAAWPLLETIYTGGARGVLTLPALLGVDTGVMVLIVTVVALAAFAVSTRVERA